MSMIVLVAKTMVTNNYFTVILSRSNLSNSIFGRKSGTNFAQISRIWSKLAEFQILNSKFQLKNRMSLKIYGQKELLNASRFLRTKN
jgi:hypothetical protein